MTFKDLINQVLIRLREDTIDVDWSGDINTSSEITEYQKLIAALVNDSKKFVESKHDWNTLFTDETLSLVNGISTYALTALKIRDGLRIMSIQNIKTGTFLKQVRRPNTVSELDAEGSDPTEYSIDRSYLSVPQYPNPIFQIRVYPTPEGISPGTGLTVTCVETQDNLSSANDIIFVPYQPVMLGAWARAVSERGEDGGSQSSMISIEAVDSLNQAIIVDQGNAEGEIDWYV